MSYTITEDGQVINKYGKIMKQGKDKDGYPRICLMVEGKRKTFFIHRLVATHHLSNPENLPQVNHKDGNKLNNHKDNLEWCSQSHNMKHAIRTGLRIWIPRDASNGPRDKLGRFACGS